MHVGGGQPNLCNACILGTSGLASPPLDLKYGFETFVLNESTQLNEIIFSEEVLSRLLDRHPTPYVFFKFKLHILMGKPKFGYCRKGPENYPTGMFFWPKHIQKTPTQRFWVCFIQVASLNKTRTIMVTTSTKWGHYLWRRNKLVLTLLPPLMVHSSGHFRLTTTSAGRKHQIQGEHIGLVVCLETYNVQVWLCS